MGISADTFNRNLRERQRRLPALRGRLWPAARDKYEHRPLVKPKRGSTKKQPTHVKTAADACSRLLLRGRGDGGRLRHACSPHKNGRNQIFREPFVGSKPHMGVNAGPMMKELFKRLRTGLVDWSRAKVSYCATSGLLLACNAGLAADFTVTSPGFSYSINGSAGNPNLTLVCGKTYTFQVNASSIHPFFINSPGVQNNNISSGTITYTVPIVPTNYQYFCSIHGFGATISAVAPPPPPAPKIKLLSLTLGNNVVLRSTGTNSWNVQPEYSTNLATTNWYALNIVSNRYAGGTNETICGRPPVPNVFIRIKSSPN